MTTKPLTLESRISAGSTPKPRFLNAFARRALLSRLYHLTDGEILLQDGKTQYAFGQKTPRCPLSVNVSVTDPQFYPDVAFGGTIGAGEAYMAGHWKVDDLTALVRIFIVNREVLNGMDGGLAWLTIPIQQCLHRVNRNTTTGSRRNISAHYDVGNEFFSLFLDDSLMYSNAIFPEPDMSLHDAQLARLQHICDKLDLKPTDHLMEIGTGWGAFAIFAARHYGCRVTTTTISREQFDFATQRIAAAGLSDHITVLFNDYRDLSGQFDKLVSIEMIEAVGHQYLEPFFEKCSKLLKPKGMMLLQAITIADQQYHAARKSVDFIKRYIFPGSFIPSVTAMIGAITRGSDMRMFHSEDIGSHYVQTLRAWRKNLTEHKDRIRELGYPDEFFLMWEFYFCYCEGGFTERAISDVQMVLTKPANRRAPILCHPAGQARTDVTGRTM